MIEIFYKEYGPVATNCTVIFDTATNECVIFDAPIDCTNDVLNEINSRKSKPRALLLTHSHWDHTGDALKLKNALDIPVLVHPEDEYRLLDQEAHKVFPMDFTLENCPPDGYLNEGDTFPLGNLRFDIVHTPGHTEGGICFIEKSIKLVVAGDTLFNGSIGRTDLPGGDFPTLIDSIHNKLMNLADDFEVLCGHGPKTTIGNERNFNPFLQ